MAKKPSPETSLEFVAAMRKGIRRSEAADDWGMAYDGKVEACALTAAYIGTLSKEKFLKLKENFVVFDSDELLPRLRRKFPGVLNFQVEHPDPDPRRDFEEKSLQAVVIDLNDNMGWTRERIATWLRRVLPKEIPAESQVNPELTQEDCAALLESMLPPNRKVQVRETVTLTQKGAH